MKDKKTIRYSTGLSSLGPVLVAVSDKGVCALFFSASVKKLVADLHCRFPSVDLCLDNTPPMTHILQQAIAHIESPAMPLNLQLDMQGTAFQRQVWQVLLTIPAGILTSYSDIASQIGQPMAFRAVANACAKNPIAVLVPCHRVRHKSGKNTGYHWGADNKKILQKREALN
ncbi:ADA regulatory protein / Methylated-DNA--protein-cysteine methyltransferase [Methylophaga frappieri]|uniref:methylated-DNA--[protein]-cysteine S-methyltransferase n=1 Tax=Methylophaga frappieri (strain ATCC BAA-2434 / DSM 25690 / JAM7) TaxID=754477 RepID=I1YES3_METFJ|nr:methylated-DNA--[protein]-cysteine S-methyltransferase [Methylophaga frappieri]AFJ01416.1 ADA regulatory protein / Methylated-DNA--protein-cysteine methyltransferase [Methylophaga frappieri]